MTGTDSRQRRHPELCRRYNFTPAEATLAAEILKGDGRAAAARRCNISEATAKTYLANAFDKTGTHRQAESSVFSSRMEMGERCTPK
jgi:DNA-binding CsgD family transcriptional regulator